MRQDDPISEILCGLAEICQFARASKPIVRAWIRDEGFPAFKSPGENRWRAIRADVVVWFRRFSRVE